MAEKKIGARIVIDGESEFRSNLISAKAALNKFQSELKLVNTVYKDNADSLEALREKQQVYINLQQEQRNKVHLLAEMQDKAVKKYTEEQSILTGLEQKREELNSALQNAKETYGENSEEVKKLTAELNDVNKQYEAQERVVQKTGDKVNSYQTSLNGAQMELEELNSAVAQNEKQLEEAEKSADGCADAMEEYGNEVQEASDRTSVFADVLKAELLAAAIKEGIKAIADGIKTIATAAVETGSSFEASMSQVAATMGMTTDEIANGSAEYEILNKAAQDCGKATMFSASQSAEALNYLALAGYDASKAAETLPRVLNLAAAGELDLAYASDLVTDSMAALGMETSELDNYIDEMAKTSQKSNTSVAQLGEATLVCAGTVSLTGQELETMNTALGVLANNGLKGAEGGTHLRNVLLSLSAPTDKASDAIDNLGLKVYDSKGKMRDLNEIMEDMNDLMSDMTPAEKTKLISTIFNKTDIAAVNYLLKSTNGEYGELNEQINDCSGAAQAMADTLNDNLKGKVTILQSALEGLGITAYDLFDDEMKEAVESATDAVGRLQGEIDDGALGVSLRNMSEALGEFAINAVGTAEKALPMLIDGFTWLLENGEIVAGLIGGVTSAKIAYMVATEAATVAQKLFNVTANANPYIFLATAIAGVIGAVTLYAKTADTSVAQLSESTKKLTDASKKLNEETATSAQKRAETREGYEHEKEACMKLADELDELQNKTTLTASEQARQAAIVDELNTAIPELNLSIDEQTGLTNMSTDALRANIEAQMELMKAEAAREDLTRIAAEQYEADKLLAELTAEQEEATNRLTEAEARLNEERAAQGDNVRYSEEAQEAYARAIEDTEALRVQIEETNGTISDLGTEYEQTMSYIADSEDALAKASGGMEELGGAASDAGTAISTMSEETQKAYNDMIDSLSDTIKNQMNLFDEFKEKTKISADEILKNMQSQVDGVSQWADDMDTLADRGINKGLLKYLADMGPEGAAYVAAFAQMTDEELEKANDMFVESLKLSEASAMNIADSYYDAGDNASKGYANGMLDAIDIVNEAAGLLAEDTLSTVKKGLDEHSPSKKTQEIGKYFDEGLERGISGNKEKIFNVIKQLTAGMASETRLGVNSEEFKKVGTQVIEGLRNGIEAGRSRVLDSVRALCEKTIQAAKDKLDIHSPSKAFAYLGEMSGEGYISGFEGSMENIDTVILEKMPDFVLLSDEMREEFDKMAENALSFYGQILAVDKAIESTGEQYNETMTDIADNEAVAGACESMGELGEAALDSAANITIMSKETIEAYKEMYSSVREKVQGQMDLFSEFSSESKLSTEDLLNNMQSQVTGIAQWTYDIKTLADRGINQGLLQYLANMGPTGAGYVSAFVDMTDEELDRANKLFETSLLLPDSTAVIITDSFAKAGADAARGLAGGITSEMKEVENASASMSDGALDTVIDTLDAHPSSKKTEDIGTNFDEGLIKGIGGSKEDVLNVIRKLTTESVTETMLGLPPAEFIEMGRKVAEGLQAGIEAGESGVITAIQSMCKSAIDTARTTLDIHSPSKAFAYLGEMSGKGYISGWEETMRNINDVIADSLAVSPEGFQGSTGAGLPDNNMSARIYTMCEKMYNIMVQYMPGMQNMQVVMDTGSLIGEIVPVLDKEFGEMEYDKSRGIYE